MTRTVVIGAGIGGLATAALLARRGHDVTVVEKNETLGGRTWLWRSGGFAFDMGPSWYLMPDVFERFFRLLGTTPDAELDLRRLSPSYRIFFGPGDMVDVPSDLDAVCRLFDTFETQGGAKLRRYLDQAGYQYDVAMREFLYRDYNRVLDFFDRRMLTEGRKLRVLHSLDSLVSRAFTSDRSRKVLEYSMVFLGGAPDNTPALYSLMSHVDLGLGVWYPMGGMAAVTDALARCATAAGAEMVLERPVRQIVVRAGRAVGVETEDGFLAADRVIANADYQHVEAQLLAPEHRQYSERYWRRRVVAPSAFMLYLGLDRPVDGLAHHTLFLERDWMRHFNSIFREPAWPDRPSYYVCAPSKTDPGTAPPGQECLVVLVPIAAGLVDDEATRERFAERTLAHLSRQLGQDVSRGVLVRRVFGPDDWSARFNAYRGTALGLSHTLRQTAVFRPRRSSRRVAGLHFVGSYTHPGIGVPMALIAAELAADAAAA